MHAPGLDALVARLCLAGGILAPVVWIAAIVVCGALTPGYDHLRDFISELAARDAPTEQLMRYAGFVFTGVCYVALAALLGWRSRFDLLALFGAGFIALGGIARVLAGVHACDPGCSSLRPSPDQALHDASARVAYLAMIVAALYWGIVGNRFRALRPLSALGLGCGVWATVFLVLMIAQPAWSGLFQRLATAALSVWMFCFAVALWRADLAVAPLAEVVHGGTGEPAT